MMGRVRSFIELTKPGLASMVLTTTGIGFYLASTAVIDWLKLFHLLVGTGLVTGGALALNQYLERSADALMLRTQARPIPTKRISPIEALIFGTVISVFGTLYLLIEVSFLTAFSLFVSELIYLLIYTPMKRKSPVSTFVGAIPGGLAPVAGWVAVTGRFDLASWVLFGILFFWQLPHSLSIAWLYREDYERAGFKLLPIAHPNGNSTIFHVLVETALLLLVGLLPTILGFSGKFYFAIALFSGGLFLFSGIALAISRSTSAARRLLYASLIYLPVVFIAMALDKLPSA